MPNIVSVESVKAGWDRALDMVMDTLLGQRSGVSQYVQKLRDQHPGISDHDLAQMIVSRKSLKSGLVGFVTGLPGLPLLPVLVPTDLVTNWQVQITMVVAVACVYGHTAETTDLKTDIYLVLAGDSAKEAVKRLGIEASKDVSKRLVDKYVTREVMQQIWKVLGPKIITKAGQKSVVSIAEMVPGVGGLVGFVCDWAATKAVGRFAIKYYGGPGAAPELLAEAEPIVLDTWAGRSQLAYTGSVSDGVIIQYGAGRRFRATVSQSDFKALLKQFRGSTVRIGTSRTEPPEGSLGEWLQHNVTKTALASYIGPILIAEGYAEKTSSSEIRFPKARGPWKLPGRRGKN